MFLFQSIPHLRVEASWNVVAHAQKPDFVFRQKGRVHLNRRGSQLCRGVRISGSNTGYTTFRGSVKSTGYLLHSPVSPSLSLPCVTVCHHVSTGPYHIIFCLSEVSYASTVALTSSNRLPAYITTRLPRRLIYVFVRVNAGRSASNGLCVSLMAAWQQSARRHWWH
jgi:hypothetical protein